MIFVMTIAMPVIAIIVVVPAIVVIAIVFVVSVAVALRHGNRCRKCQTQTCNRAGTKP